MLILKLNLSFCLFQSETEKKIGKDKKVSLMADKKNDLLLSNRSSFTYIHTHPAYTRGFYLTRLSDNRGKDDIHIRAKKLKEHYRAVQACDQIMAYGFVIILFLLTGFYWFIIIFSEQIRFTFHVSIYPADILQQYKSMKTSCEQRYIFQEYHLIAPTFVFGSLSLGTLNILIR